MNSKYTLAAIVTTLALLVISADAFAGTHLLSTLFTSPEGALMAPVMAAALPDAIKAELEKISDQIKSQAETAEKEIKANARLTDETRANVDKLLTEQGALQARLQSAEQLVAKLEQGGGQYAAPQSMGEQLTTNEDFQAWAARAASGGGSKFNMDVKAVVTSDGASAGDLIVPQRREGIIAPGLRRLTIRDLLNVVPTSSNAIQYVRETGYTNNADVVAENPTGLKPESNLTFEADQAAVTTIAHWIHASRQVLADIPTLRGYIDGRLRYGLKLKEETQLLKGSGVGLNIDGLYTQARAYANPGVTVQNETRIDRLRLALLQVELAEAWADGIVISPLDWAAIELQKTDDNAYLFANPRGITTPALWGRNVVPTQSMGSGEFLVGAFGGGIAAELHDREDVNVMVATQDDRDFVKNMVKILMEERLALTVYRPEAFVKGTMSDLDTP
ncbi:phage major capsid protein [Stenotrophomonas sp. Sm10]|uniref:phage major capsid protein n=1 Tax=Stenotrophomonas sp. Sm10 TaxID=3002754 RepID=UPI0027E497AD|nr:phage major capsid protein [Stenotrophomonas sp. Sm10]MDQ7310632.1 phage major capsid protein [Stenotrophomonas sp. Sm10]